VADHTLLSKLKTNLLISDDGYNDHLNDLLTYGENYIKTRLDVSDDVYTKLKANENIIDITIMLYATQMFRNNIKDKYHKDFTPILSNLIKTLFIVITRKDYQEDD
jgi:hypothetical protein